MKPRGPLMIEHRLIEKMIEIIERKIPEINKSGKVDPVFVDTAVDFIRMYADKTHHGKEEDILFRECVKKDMSPQDATIMNELIEEHKFGRKTVANIVEAKNKYLKGEDTIRTILEQLNVLAEFYPKHIRKEDVVFFPNAEKYFSEAELQGMLEEFWEFDRAMIHHKYKLVVEELRNKNC
jgi:hemerythrin-like domain-containing protein